MRTKWNENSNTIRLRFSANFNSITIISVKEKIVKHQHATMTMYLTLNST